MSPSTHSLACISRGPMGPHAGKLILETRGSLAKAPDGNGGVYLSLARSGMLDAMDAAGIECVDCYCVDNSLARLGDPRFIGYCHGAAKAVVGARVVAKAYPEEKVKALHFIWLLPTYIVG